jgi:GDP-D-mannose dehydratase
MVSKTMSARDQILGKIGSIDSVKHPGAFKGASEDFDFRASLEVVGARVVSPEELENLKGDSSKLRKELSWKPEYTFETMLDEMIEYWVEYYGK